MNNDFFPLVFRQKYIRRWGLMRNITTETLSEHSFEVSVIAHALAVIGNKYFNKHYDTGRICELALYHDAQEVFTGDLPTPIKYYNEEIRNNYASIEENASKQFLSKLPPELAEEYSSILGETQVNNDKELTPLVKAADKLCAYIKCIEEEKCGNMEFQNAKNSISVALDKIDLPELKWFIENVLPSFDKNLDELQK